MQVNFLVFDGTPESFGENVVVGAPAPIHADFDFFMLQTFQIFRAGEMAALIAVPDLWLGLQQSVVDRREHEIQFQSLAERPTENVTGIPTSPGRRSGTASHVPGGCK